MKIYAAVIEWPDDLDGLEPTLILARTGDERDQKIVAKVLDIANRLSDPEWRETISDADSSDWSDWLEPLEFTRYGNPFVNLHEEEL